MSKFGKLAINIPNNISIEIFSLTQFQGLFIVGPLGSIAFWVPKDCSLSISESSLCISFPDDLAFWGTLHRSISYSILGLSSGVYLYLNLNGVGYKASVNNKQLSLSLGFSHPIIFSLPDHVVYYPDYSKPNKLSFHSPYPSLLSSWLSSIVNFKSSSHDPYKHKGLFISSS